ncbi:MAG TPA: YegS/Rv2252/BmrU family lipid kinase [Anaerolineales bacterium]|nr:YegS/Rv2252/BmrU family lipid kinase [Anaerolineales bacterium]
MRSALIVYNPAAGRFSVRPFLNSAANELESAGWKVDAAETQSGEHTIELAKQAAAEKKDAVFAVGGDGTIGNVVNGLVGSETALGVLPAGTANVWSIELGLQPFAWTRPWALRKNASILANAPCYAVDVGMCNQFAFMMWAGIGLDALTIQSLEPRIRLEKFFAVPEYAAKAIWKAAQWSGIRLRLWADGQEVEGHFLLAVATNIRHYMGGLSNLSPDAYLDDGLLDLWLFSGNNIGDALRHAYDLWRGSHERSDAARRIRFHTLRVEAKSPFLIQSDAEPRGSTQTAEIRIRSRELKMLMPPRGMDLLKNASSPSGNHNGSSPAP